MVGHKQFNLGLHVNYIFTLPACKLHLSIATKESNVIKVT